MVIQKKNNHEAQNQPTINIIFVVILLGFFNQGPIPGSSTCRQTSWRFLTARVLGMATVPHRPRWSPNGGFFPEEHGGFSNNVDDLTSNMFVTNGGFTWLCSLNPTFTWFNWQHPHTDMDLNNESEELYECQIKSMSGCEIPRWISGTRWDMVWIGDSGNFCAQMAISSIPSLQWLHLSSQALFTQVII